MMALLLISLPFLAFLGMLVVLGLALVAFHWPSVERHILWWLQRRRKAREARFQRPGPRPAPPTAAPRQALRRPR
jgi:hypothetical protein